MESVTKRNIIINTTNRARNLRYRNRLQMYMGSDILLRTDLEYLIAGGFLNAIDGQRPIKDVDLYPKNDEMREKIVATLINHNWVTNEEQKTFMRNDKKVQVLNNYEDPRDILAGFDFTVCMKGWIPYEGAIITYAHYLRDLRLKQLIYNTNSKYPIKNIIHMTKYINYGYRIGPMDLMTILFNINKLNLDDPNVFKEQLMYYESQPLLDSYINLYKKISGPTQEKKDLLRTVGLSGAAAQIDRGQCATCNHIIQMNEFRDELSRREYGISGMCQRCQDEIFDPPVGMLL